jgi:hypothetical protein
LVSIFGIIPIPVSIQEAHNIQKGASAFVLEQYTNLLSNIKKNTT